MPDGAGEQQPAAREQEAARHQESAVLEQEAATERESAAAEQRLSAFVAVIIAFATFVGAVVGYLQADSSNASSDWRQQAEQLSLDALGSGQRAQQQAQVEYEAYARSVEQRTAASNALLRSFHAGSDETEEERFLLEQARWERLAAASEELTEIEREGEFGPEQDRTFPSRYFASKAYESFRLNALQDAANQEATRLEQSAASYTAILAMLAVSLYLFGLTLAEHGRRLRRGFLLVGLALLAAAGTWTALTALSPSSAINEEAAAAYARGHVAVATAHDSAGYRAAEEHFSRAIGLRPTFARAYVDRAGTIVLGATPQRTGFASIIPEEALQRARSDLERARELGLENAPVYGSLGFYSFLEGVQASDPSLLEESIAYSRRATELDPGYPIFPFNLGVALVAAERFEEARDAYAEGVADSLYLDESRTQLRDDFWMEQNWLAGALTDLVIVEHHRPELAEHIRGFKEMIVGPISRGRAEAPLSTGAATATPAADAPAAPPVSVSGLLLEVRPEGVQWWATLDGLDTDRHTVSTQWYRQDPAGLAWAVVPEVSGTATPFEQVDGQQTVYRSYIAAVFPPDCLEPGSYRAEIYVDGQLVATGDVEAGFEDLEAFVGRDITLGFCRPAAWQPLEDALPGLLAGYRSEDGQYGVYGFRYALPRSYGDVPTITADVMEATLESFAEYLPGVPVHNEAAGTTDDYFLGLERTAWRWYDSGSGWVRAAAGMTADGAVVVGLVFGPYEWFDGEDPYFILRSFVPYE